MGLAVAASASACSGKSRPGDTASAKTSDAGATIAATSDPVPKGTCPNTGQWAECSAFDRLDHAGLAPRRDSAAGVIRLPPLTGTGTRLLLGGAELDVFIYPNQSARARDEGRLDKGQYIEATEEPTLRGEATLIRSANLLAILRSRNDHQRERVSDALSAGPPQASSTGSATQLPPSRSVP